MFVYLCIALIALAQYVQPAATAVQPETPTALSAQQNIPPAIPLTYAFNYEASVIFQAISLPLQDLQDSFTLNVFSAIEKNFGSKGLDLNLDQIILIKKAYLYLIFLTKLDLVQSNPAFKQYQSDFARFLTDNSSPQPHIPDSTLVKSVGWNSVVITAADIQNSAIWQLFCQTAVCDVYSFFYTALNIIHNVEQQTFNYIPHIETSFYDHDYTNLRTINELTRIKIILETKNKDFFLAQCPSWASKVSMQNNSLEKQILLFRQTPFYQNTHDIYTLLGIQEDNASTIQTKSLLTPKQLQSPLKEQVWGYFMLNELLTMFYGLIKPDSIENVLAYCSQSNLQPVIFPYSSQDYVYFEELLAVKSKTESTHTQSLHPSPPVYKTEKTHVPIALSKTLQKAQQALGKAIRPQCCSWFTNIIHTVGSAIEHTAEDAYSDIKEAGEDVGDAISSAAQAAIHATVGIAEGVFGSAVGIFGNITGIESIEEFGTTVQKDAVANLEATTKDLQDSVNDFADGVKEAVSSMAEIDGSIISIVTDDQKLGQDFESVCNQVAGALINVAAKYTDTLIQFGGDVDADELKFGMEFADTVASAVGAIATGNISNLEENAETLLNSTIKSITQTFSNLVSDAKSILGAVVQGLAAVVNSLTTIFIDISREITFMVMAAGNLATDIATGQIGSSSFEQALKNAQSTRDSITNTLEAHRQTINQVMGVAVAIGFTVATEVASGGTATEADVAIDEELADGDIAASTSETTGETGTETTGEVSGETPPSQPAPEEPAPSQTTEDDTADEEAEEKSDWKSNVKKGLKIGLKAFGNILNIVFGSFSIISGINADAQDALKEQQQSEQLINIWEFTNDSKIYMIQNQSAYLKELQSKQQAVIGNQILNLAFMKNRNYGSINQSVQQLSSVFAKQFIPQLTPDANGLFEANIGTSWAVESPYINLYPTEGFPTVSVGRPDFPYAQEVAQAPYATQSPGVSSSKAATKKSKKLWFNQKVIGLDNVDAQGVEKKPVDPLIVSIDLQIIYMVNADFYTGLYLGGNYYDYTSAAYLADLTKNGNFDIDASHLAKMVVIFRTSANGPLQVGIYEHEGKGWILQEQLPEAMQLSNYHTYSIKAELNGENLTYTISIDNDSTNSVTKTVSVTQLENQRTYGIISSGVAIQWSQLSPAASYNINRQVRPDYQKTPEIEREKTSKINASKAFKPKFGTMSLQAISSQAIMLDQYLYTTTGTNLQKISPNHATDYIVFASNQNGSLSNIGTMPNISNNQERSSMVAVSLITGNAYDSTGNMVAHSSNAWSAYQVKFGPFDQAINSYITAAQNIIQTKLAHISFGSFDLDIISNNALQSGIYIYSCSQTIDAKDANKKPILDYLTPAEISGSELGNTVGMPPTSPNAQGLISLVTGNLYSKTASLSVSTVPTPLSTGYPAMSLLSNIDPTSKATIVAAQNAYNAYLAQQQAPPVKQKSVTVQTFNSTTATGSNLAPTSTIGPSLGGGPSVNLSGGPGSQATIASLQQQAAGGASFQLGTPSGPSVSLGNGP